MAQYWIENIGIDHPALQTGNLVACAIARCRQMSVSPYHMHIDCRNLCSRGTTSETCDVAWQEVSEASAVKAQSTYQPRRLTEDAAIGLGASALAVLAEGEITDVTAHGTGVDYWVDGLRAVLEISGIETGNSGALGKRHSEKEKQLRSGSLFQAGFPGYVFVVDFVRKKSILSYYV